MGPFGAGETAQGFTRRIPSVTSRTEHNCGTTSLRVETVYFPLTYLSPDGHMGIPSNARLAGASRP
jgi:hypothetical protein